MRSGELETSSVDMDPSSSQAGPHALRLQRSRSMVPVVLVGKEPRKEQRLKSKQSSHRPHVGVGRAAAEFSCEEVSSSRSWFSIQSERLEARPSLFFVRLGVWATRIRRIPCHRLSYGLAVTRDDCEIGARPPYLQTNLQWYVAKVEWILNTHQAGPVGTADT